MLKYLILMTLVITSANGNSESAKREVLFSTNINFVRYEVVREIDGKIPESKPADDDKDVDGERIVARYRLWVQIRTESGAPVILWEQPIVDLETLGRRNLSAVYDFSAGQRGNVLLLLKMAGQVMLVTIAHELPLPLSKKPRINMELVARESEALGLEFSRCNFRFEPNGKLLILLVPNKGKEYFCEKAGTAWKRIGAK